MENKAGEGGIDVSEGRDDTLFFVAGKRTSDTEVSLEEQSLFSASLLSCFCWVCSW